MRHSVLTKGKILVTGGARFIGSALIWALNELGIENILVSDQLSTDEKWLNLAPLKFDDYIAADTLLKEVEHDKRTLRDISWVFHLGACSSTTERDADRVHRAAGNNQGKVPILHPGFD